MGSPRSTSDTNSVVTVVMFRCVNRLTRGPSFLVFCFTVVAFLVLLHTDIWGHYIDEMTPNVAAGSFEGHPSFQGFQNPRIHNTAHSIHHGVFQNKTRLSANEHTLYLITPTYNRPTQMADLTRAAQVVMSVPNCHWIVVEDAVNRTPWIEYLLSRLGISHTVMACKRPPSRSKKPIANGYTQRNCALQWLSSSSIQEGVIYFIDDDNTYDLRNFEEVRKARKVVLVPTGNLVDSGVSSPLYDGKKIVDWIDPWPAGRKFPTDMACFAINVRFWRERGAPQMVDVRGQLETKLLQDLRLQVSEFEPQADNCTKVYGWHTQTKWDKKSRPQASSWKEYTSRYPRSNLAQLQKVLTPLLT